MSDKQLDRLKGQLLTSGMAQKNNALYQVIDQLIGSVQKINNDLANLNIDIPPAAGPDETFLTSTDESVDLPNSRELLAGTGIAFSDAVANKRTVSSTIPDLSGKHFATVTDESASLTNSRQLLAGVGVSFDDSVANARTMSIASGSGFLTGTVNPQGVQAAGVGTWYINTVTGYAYQKCGGGSTTYGWYLVPPAGFPGPIMWDGFAPLAGNAGGSILTSDGHGQFAVTSPTAPTTPTRTIIAGKTFAQIATSATTGSVASVNTPTTSFNCLDDDIDTFIHINIGAVVSNVRFWFAVTGASSPDTDTLGSGGNGALGIRFSTVTSDVGFRGYSSITGAGNQSLTANTGSALGAFAANTQYRLRIRFVRQGGTPTAYFSVNDGTEQSLTTNIPVTGNPFFLMWGAATRANAAFTWAYRSVRAIVGS